MRKGQSQILLEKNLEHDYTPETHENFNLWIDYWYQLSLTKETHPKNILEVGKGSITSEILFKKNKPDLVGDIRKIPVANNSFDTVCASRFWNIFLLITFPWPLNYCP